MEVSIIGLDIAKTVFHVVQCDARGKEVGRRMLKRAQVLEWFARQAACTVVLEACGGAHHWGRELARLGHRPKLLPPRAVKAFLRRAKNDFNDARALAEAGRQPGVRAVPLATAGQQALQAVHRLRAGLLRERMALNQRLRGLLLEYGIALPQGAQVVRRRLPALLEDADNGLPSLLRDVLAEGYERLVDCDTRLAWYDRRLQHQVREVPNAARLARVHGLGAVNATALAAKLGDGRAWRDGREFAATLGLVPRQHSSGGRTVLRGITKRGDPYLRTLLVHAARSVLAHAARREDRLSRWARALKARRGGAVATVALANKLARLAWALVRWERSYEPAWAGA